MDGALLALTHEEEPLLARLQTNRLPLVVLGKPLGFEKAFSWVAIDDEQAAFTVVSYLAGKVGGTDRDGDRARCRRAAAASALTATGVRSATSSAPIWWPMATGRCSAGGAGPGNCSGATPGCGGCSSPRT